LQSGDFVANMEKVLEVNKRPYDENHPVVCMDESPKQLMLCVYFYYRSYFCFKLNCQKLTAANILFGR